MQHTARHTVHSSVTSSVRRAIGLMAVAALSLGLTACSSDDEKAADNTAQACADAEQLRTTIDSASSQLSSTSTVEEWRTAKEAIEKSVDELEKSLEKTSEDAWTKVDDAWDDFTDALDDVPEDATVPEAGQTLVDEVDRVKAARDQAISGLDCS